MADSDSLPPLLPDGSNNLVQTIASESSPNPTHVLNTSENITSPSLTPTNDEENNDGKKKDRTNKSVVWNCFEKKLVKEKVVAECKRCKKQLTAISGNGTSHLLKHFKKCFGSKFKQIDMQQIVLRKNLIDSTVSNYVFDSNLARDALSKMIVTHEYPICMVDHIGFKIYSMALQPLFKVPTRNTIKIDIFKIYEIEKVKMKKLLEKNNSRVAITTDMWTAGPQKKGYMAVTAHFIDDSWTLQSRILRFIHVPTPHTSLVLSKALLKCMMEWNIDNKVAAITLDNCSTNDAMIKHLLEKLERDKLMLNGNFLHMRCASHILNLIVQDGLDVIKDAIQLVRESVLYWIANPKRVENFEEAARQLRLPVTKKLSYDCRTRWNSTFIMLRTAIMYKDVFARLSKMDTSYICMPSEPQWDLSRDICKRLSMFNDVSELFSGTKYVTANQFFLKICEIKKELDKWNDSSNIVIRIMATNMSSKFDKYWSKIVDVMAVAIFLDPRYKITLLEFYFPQFYGQNAAFHIEHVRRLCYDLVSEYHTHSRKTSNLAGEKDVGSESPSYGSMSEFEFFVKSKKQCTVSLTKTEFDHYLGEPLLPRSEKFDILGWWNQSGLKYPTLQTIARDIFCIPVSSVASEAAFSTGGRLVSAHRSRLHHDTLEALMCLQNWLHTTKTTENPSEFASILDEVDIDTDFDISDSMIIEEN